MSTALKFIGKHDEFLHDATAEIDLEGSLSCGKTTVALWKELEAMKRYAGIWIMLGRWIQDQVDTLLCPAFEQMARIHSSTWAWHSDDKFYEMANGSRAYPIGLKTISSDPLQRYGKIRGWNGSRIYIDQAEQLPADISSELRARLRPDIEARLRGDDFPRQLTFTPNPTNDQHWLAKQFPEHNKIKGRRYYSLSLFDNAHNLPPDQIEAMLREFPEGHPKHQTVILGKRGPSITGEAVYDGLFDRKLHVGEFRTLPHVPLLEGYHLGKHNPCWVVAQRTAAGGIRFLGGILGKDMMAEDFLPMVKRYRGEWFNAAELKDLKACTAPMGSTTGSRFSLLNILRAAKVDAICQVNANAPDVRLGMIEYVASELRRRLFNKQEAIGIESRPERWLYANIAEEPVPTPFLQFAFDGGYVWSPHFVSVSNKEIRQPEEDDEYANAMRCVENICLNFCVNQPVTEAPVVAKPWRPVSPFG